MRALIITAFASLLVTSLTSTAAASGRSNDDFESASPIGPLWRALSDRVVGPGRVVHGQLELGDVDYYKVRVRAGQLLTVSIREPARGEFHDSLLGVFDPDGNLVADNDDGGPLFLSRLAVTTDGGGLWRIAVAGTGDTDFTGEKSVESFSYSLVVAVADSGSTTEEQEANDKGSQAESIFPRWMRYVPWRTAVVAGSLEPGDVDQFEVEVWGNAKLFVDVYDDEDGEFNDSVLRVETVDAGDPVEDDDGGLGLLSNVDFLGEGSGWRTERIRLTGFDPTPADADGHPESFDYHLVISVDRDRRSGH